MTDTYELVDFMKWLQSKGIKFEIPFSYQKVMSGMYLKEDKFYELCDNYLCEFDKNYNPFEEVEE